MRHIHLDPIGGLAGDMFVAALLDAFPEHRDDAIAAGQRLAPVACRLSTHNDGILSGARFIVDEAEPSDNSHHHDHKHWSDIRHALEASSLPQPALHHAIGIFTGLAEAEARVHGVTPEQVAFHEVGAADSIADIAAAAWIIAAIAPARWSVASLPLGSGRIHTAHGLMPIPAPATALLLQGFPTHDDGVSGERITPTGAAILHYLSRSQDFIRTARPTGTLRQSGFGFGARTLPGISNCLRVLVFDLHDRSPPGDHRELAVIGFEIDDQSGEDLAAGLDRLRNTEGVHDVMQMPAFGKKGRLATHVQVLARPDAIEPVVAACYAQTTTIGLRTQIVQARALPRRSVDVALGDETVRVKLVQRPAGVTGKAEADDIRPRCDHATRALLRREAERLAIVQGQQG